MEIARHAFVDTPRELYLSGPSFGISTAEEESYDVSSTIFPAWRAVLDEASGNTYYWDPVSGETSWDPRFATMPEEDIRFRFSLGESENSFITGNIAVSGPNNEDESFSSTNLITSTPAKPSQLPFEQAIIPKSFKSCRDVFTPRSLSHLVSC